MESFSAYARQFVGDMERPDVDKITGLSPVISIEQKTTNKNPRSTVGTITEIYDFFRLLFARTSVAYSYNTGKAMVQYSEEEIVKEIKEEVKEEPKAKAKTRAKPKVKIVKEFAGVSRDPPDGRGNAPSSPVEPVEQIEEKEEPVEKPVKVDKLKQLVRCPDCNIQLTAHTLKYIHKRRGFCKADIKTPEATPEVKSPEQPKTKITEDIVNDYIKQNPDIISNYLRNERAMKAQKKQMNARSLLNNAF